MECENISFPVKVVLGKASLFKESFVHLKEGDIIILDQKVREPLTVLVQEESIFKGYAGNKEIKRAIKLL